MGYFLETRQQHRDRIMREVAELDRFCRRREALTAEIDWQAMTREDREIAEEIESAIALCEHELGLEMGFIWRGDHGIF